MKKLLLLFLALVFMLTITPVQAAQKATVINPDTGHRKAVIVGDPHAFDNGYCLEIEYGVQRLSDDMMGYSVVSSYKTTLSASMTSTQSTVNVSSIKSKDGTTLTMGVLGTKVYLTIEPGGNKEEIVMATGISGSAWSGLTRGLAFTGTSTAAVSANKKTHSAGSTIIMSNVHYVYDELADKDSDETIGGAKTFSGTVDFSTVTPTVPVAAPTANDEIANKKYVDDVITAGAPDGTETTKGIWEGATRTEMASSTATGGTGAGLLLKSEYATSSPDVRGLNVIVSENDGYIDQDWIDLSEDFGFSGDNILTGDTTQASTTFTASTTWDILPEYTSDPVNDNEAVRKSYIDTEMVKILNLSASETLQASSDTIVTQTGGAPVKNKEIIVRLGGTITVRVDLREQSQEAGHAQSQIYLNGVAEGALQNQNGTTFATLADIIQVKPYDKVQLYLYQSAGTGTVEARNFRIYWTEALTSTYYTIELE